MLPALFVLLVLQVPQQPGAQAHVQATRWPLSVLRCEPGVGELQLEAEVAGIQALAQSRSAQLPGVLLPDGDVVGLSLARLDVARLQFGFQVDGAPAPGLLDGLDLSVWSGAVVGEPDSRVALAFSRAGSHGWVQRGAQLFHLISSPRTGIRFVSAERLASQGIDGRYLCAQEQLDPALQRDARVAEPGQAKAGAAAPLYACSIAVETDYQLNQVFGGDLAAESAYVASLMTWAGYRFEEQVEVAFTFPYVQLYTTPADPWSVPDLGGNCVDMIYEFQAAWQGSVPAGAALGHFLSGAPLGCGAGFIGGLCNALNNFSVTGNIDGSNVFPIEVGPSNFNFYGVTHELGHNLAAIHTHDYCPPIDECAPPGYFGACQTQKVCTSEGTLMSYCGGCPGGFANITTYFHPQSVLDMRAFVESTCLPLACGDPSTYCTAKLSSNLCLPAIGWQGHPTLSGLDDFVVTAEQVHNNQNGLLFWGLAAASQPFNGGTLCVAPPIKRLGVQGSSGNPPPTSDCSGSFAQPLSHQDLIDIATSPGTSVYAQYWFRDSASLGGSGLSDGILFTLCD